jgi:hypothetical protein
MADGAPPPAKRAKLESDVDADQQKRYTYWRERLRDVAFLQLPCDYPRTQAVEQV